MLKKILKYCFGLGVVLSTGLYFLGNKCGSACDPHSFLNPLGSSNENIICPAVCVFTPHPWFYLVAEITLLVALVLVLVKFLPWKQS